MDGAPAAEPTSGDESLPIDSALIKVLAADSRRDILRLLKQRRMTLTELATQLNLKKATVLEHLKRLTDAGLIRRMEDERLWVYYELTRQGVRIVNPGRTRFYLIMGATAAAGLLIGGVLVAALVLQAPHLLNVPPPSDHGAPATPAATDGVGSNAGSTASGQPTPPEVGLRLQAPARAWRGLDGDVDFRITRTGAPAAGQLVLTPSLADGSRSVSLATDASGTATLTTLQLDALTPQRYDLAFAAAPSAGAQTTNFTTLGTFDVRAPPIVVEPLWAVEGVDTQFTLRTPVDPTPTLRLDGAPVDATRAGMAYAFHATLPAGASDVSVGRLFHQSVRVLPNATLDVGAWDGSAWDVRVLRGGAPASGASVVLGSLPPQTTDADGRVRLAPTSGGTTAQTLRVTFADGVVVARDVQVDASGVRPLAPQFQLVTFTTSAGATGVDARFELADALGVGGDVAVTLLVDGEPVASQLVQVPRATAGRTPVTLHAMPELPPGQHAARLTLDAAPLLSFRGTGVARSEAATTPASNATSDAAGTTRTTSDAAVFFVSPTTSTPTVTTPATQNAFSSTEGAPAKVPGAPIALVLATLGAIALAAARRVRRAGK